MTDAEKEASLNTKDRIQLVPTEVGNGTILEVIGLQAGNALLDFITNAPDFRHVRPLLEQGRLRVDSALVRSTLDVLATAAVISNQDATKLKALAERTISRAEELGIPAVKLT